MIVARHRTAIHRHRLSRPLSVAIEDGLLTDKDLVFDYGCGHGDDLRNLRTQGIACSGWDPIHNPDVQPTPAGVVNLGYVVNVVEDPNERTLVLHNAWSLTQKLMIVSARLTADAKNLSAEAFEDGYLTRVQTFQKFYEQTELREWIDATLELESVPAGPGIFYVFRNESTKQAFIASRYRTKSALPRVRRSEILFDEHKSLLQPLMEFLAIRGRLPVQAEFEQAGEIQNRLGSLKKAFTIIKRVTGQEKWDEIANERANDLRIYMALARFGRRPQFSYLPTDLQLDIRAFFGNYHRACVLADELLFSAGNIAKIDEACRASNVGKLMPRSLYVHTTALSALPTILRIYEGCARSYVGSVEGANVIKLHRSEPRVSYLSYPDFDRDPHPSLAGSLTVPLQTFRIKFRDYRESENPFILHRKEELVSSNHPLREKFARLTRQEERFGLYQNPELIGTRDGWRAALVAANVRLTGHRLSRQSTNS